MLPNLLIVYTVSPLSLDTCQEQAKAPGMLQRHLDVCRHKYKPAAFLKEGLWTTGAHPTEFGCLELNISSCSGGEGTDSFRSQQDVSFCAVYMWEVKDKQKNETAPNSRKPAAQQWALLTRFVRAGQPKLRGFYQKYTKQGIQHKHFWLCFHPGNGKEEGNKCNRRSRRAEQDGSAGDRKQFITYWRVFSESSVLQLRQQCRSARLHYTQTHKHTNIPSCLEPPLPS